MKRPNIREREARTPPRLPARRDAYRKILAESVAD
jgi:hypothetical protein